MTAALAGQTAPPSEAPGRWLEEAACHRYPALVGRFTEVETFDEAHVAFLVCSQCPVRIQCLQLGQSLAADGVWGGQLLHRGSVKSRPSKGRS